MQVLKELWTEIETPETRNAHEYELELRNRLEETCQLARDSLYKAQGVSNHHYDKGARDRRFEVGQKVLILLPTDRNKFLLQWKGLYTVTKIVGTCDYKVKVKGRDKIYHANLLKLYSERENEGIEVAASAVIEATPYGDGVVDHESLLELGIPQGKETYKDVAVNPKLGPEPKEQVWNLLREFSDIFTDQPGTTHLVEHKIITTTSEPIRVKQYPIPYAKQVEIADEVKKMVKARIIEPSNSPYNSSIVLVNKSDGSKRFCIDLKRVNIITRFDSEPMPNSKSIMTKASEGTYFTKMDLSKGFWQIPMEDSSKTNNGLLCSQYGKFSF